MLDKIRTLFPRRVRLGLYGVALAALPLLLAYGLVEPQVAPLWLGFVAALLFISPDEPR